MEVTLLAYTFSSTWLSFFILALFYCILCFYIICLKWVLEKDTEISVTIHWIPSGPSQDSLRSLRSTALHSTVERIKWKGECFASECVLLTSEALVSGLPSLDLRLWNICFLTRNSLELPFVLVSLTCKSQSYQAYMMRATYLTNISWGCVHRIVCYVKIFILFKCWIPEIQHLWVNSREFLLRPACYRDIYSLFIYKCKKKLTQHNYQL